MFSCDQPFRELGLCRLCKKSLNLPFCTGPDKEYHRTVKNGKIGQLMSQIQDSINLVQFLRLCESDYIFANLGLADEYSHPSYKSDTNSETSTI